MTWSCTRWNSPIGTPNCTRCWLCATDISNTAWQPPTMNEHSTGQAPHERALERRPALVRRSAQQVGRRHLDAVERHLALRREEAGQPRARTPGAARVHEQQPDVAGASPVRAATIRCVATVASPTKSLTPSSR